MHKPRKILPCAMAGDYLFFTIGLSVWVAFHVLFFAIYLKKDSRILYKAWKNVKGISETRNFDIVRSKMVSEKAFG